MSENVYKFTAEASDNKARFRCEAINVMSPAPLKAEVELTVLCKYSLYNPFYLATMAFMGIKLAVHCQGVNIEALF